MICQLWDTSKPKELGIPHTDESIFFSWKGKVFFSATRRGKSMDCHVAAKGKNKRLLREAIHFFCRFIVSTFTWCESVLACVKMRSVKNLCVNCGFSVVGPLLINDEKYEVLKWVE